MNARNAITCMLLKIGLKLAKMPTKKSVNTNRNMNFLIHIINPIQKPLKLLLIMARQLNMKKKNESTGSEFGFVMNHGKD